MATTAEKQALGFLVLVALGGAAVQAVGVARFDQAAAVAGAGSARPATDAGAAALDRQLAAIDSARRSPKPARKPRSAAKPRGPANRPPPPAAAPPRLIDINAASAAELERLPRVGPALAERIVAWRARHGPFGGPDDLRHVRGIGPSTVRLLVPLVTFSGRQRPMISESPQSPVFHSDLDDRNTPTPWQPPQPP